MAGGRGEKVTLFGGTVLLLPLEPVDVVQGEGRMVRWEKNLSIAFCSSSSFSGLQRERERGGRIKISNGIRCV